MVGLKFVIEYGEAVNGSGFAAEHEGTECDRQGAGANSVDFRRSVVALWSDPDRKFARRLAMLSGISIDMFAGMFCVRLQRGNQSQLGLTRVSQSVSGVHW